MPNYIRVFVQNSYVFITIVSYDRKPILIENINILKDALKNSKKFYKYEIFGMVVLPDHIHLIIRPDKIDEYPKIISRIKHYFSRNINCSKNNLTESKIKKREKGIWQRRYWEHTILDEKDLYNSLDYIHYNPVKHGYTKAAKDWEYSSFKKFVKQNNYEINWGSSREIENIKDLDFE
jgi:putative transposase